MSKTHLGHQARKRFGQNFLHDAFIIDQIVSAINPQLNQNLLEIGPGLGALTEPVAEQVERLICIELDRDLAQRLRTHPFINKKLHIIEADILSVDLTDIATTANKLRVFGNLPYNISTPLIFHMFNFLHLIQDMHFMLQYEVVKRLCASVGDKLYGRLSIMTAYYCQSIPVLKVPPSAFKPKVESAIVRLIPHEKPPVTVNHVESLEKVVAIAFNQRRKTLRNSLAGILSADLIETIDIDSSARAQELSLNDYARLSNLYDQQR